MLTRFDETNGKAASAASLSFPMSFRGSSLIDSDRGQRDQYLILIGESNSTPGLSCHLFLLVKRSALVAREKALDKEKKRLLKKSTIRLHFLNSAKKITECRPGD